MIRTIIGGIAVGIANIIPGVSGGTMMVILGVFNRVMDAISNLLKRDNPNRLADVLFLGELLLGAAIGLIGFAKVLGYLLSEFEVQTMYWFIGLIAFSIPVFLKAEVKGKGKVKGLPTLIGMAIIFALVYFNPGEASDVHVVYPDVSVWLCVKLVLIGAIGGASMLLPGVSGSMVLLILGEYYLFRAYLANVLLFQLNILIPLGFMGIGIILGIVISAKVCGYFLKHNHDATISFILGLIIASTLVLIPLDAAYDMNLILTSFISFAFGGVMVMGIEKIAG